MKTMNELNNVLEMNGVMLDNEMVMDALPMDYMADEDTRRAQLREYFSNLTGCFDDRCLTQNVNTALKDFHDWIDHANLAAFAKLLVLCPTEKRTGAWHILAQRIATQVRYCGYKVA